MATLRKRNGKWQVQVRRTGHAPRAQSFMSKADAQQWARQVEAELDRSILTYDVKALERTVLRELLLRYRNTVTCNKRGHAPEAKRIEVFLREAWAFLPLSRVTSETFSRYRDARLATVKAGTVIRELGLLHTIFETARKEWCLPIATNPIAQIKKPKAPQGRTRRLKPGEFERLMEGCATSRNDWLRSGILLAIETGMRRGEILCIRWKDYDPIACTLTIPHSKNGFERCIPLSQKAKELLEARRQPNSRLDGLVFPVSAVAFRLAWERCKKRLAKAHPDILSLRFHDLRHEAVSRFFELGLSVPEVALISGHRDPRMLFRYTHLKAADIVVRLQRMATDSPLHNSQP